jgi:hypothetical protein
MFVSAQLLQPSIPIIEVCYHSKYYRVAISNNTTPKEILKSITTRTKKDVMSLSVYIIKESSGKKLAW